MGVLKRIRCRHGITKTRVERRRERCVGATEVASGKDKVYWRVMETRIEECFKCGKVVNKERERKLSKTTTEVDFVPEL